MSTRSALCCSLALSKCSNSCTSCEQLQYSLAANIRTTATGSTWPTESSKMSAMPFQATLSALIFSVARLIFACIPWRIASDTFPRRCVAIRPACAFTRVIMRLNSRPSTVDFCRLGCLSCVSRHCSTWHSMAVSVAPSNASGLLFLRKFTITSPAASLKLRGVASCDSGALADGARVDLALAARDLKGLLPSPSLSLSSSSLLAAAAASRSSAHVCSVFTAATRRAKSSGLQATKWRRNAGGRLMVDITVPKS
mmetsp:Transcript_169/g.435  ORF Transcript_169/g.435 Transcript_169/m.435 type:complete len:254 (+) Transcript_169:884-1645(+)